MKKLFSVFLALALVLSLFGCTQPMPTQPTEPSITAPTQATEPSTQATDPTEEATEPSTEATEPSTEATEPSTEATEPTTEATEPSTKPTQPPTEPPTQPTEPPTEPPTQPTEPPTEPTQPQPSESQLLVDKAFALAYGQTLSGTHTLTGTVTEVETIKTSKGYASFTVRVQGSTGNKALYVYQGKPATSGQLTVKVGDRVTLTGTLKNYKGTIEFEKPSYVNHDYDPSYDQPAQIPSETISGGTVERDGIYDSKQDVARYIHTYGSLPKNFVTKSQYNNMGKPADKCCGGDRFYNNEGLLPNKSGRLYYECDIDTYGSSSRGAKRIVYSNDGLIFYTSGHYESFTQLYVN